MAEYTIRQGFTIQQGSLIYSGGDTVELSEFEFVLHKHKLEGIESTVATIDFPSSPKSGGGKGNFPAPYVSQINSGNILQNKTKTIIISGSFFTPDTVVSSEGATLNSLKFVNSHLIEVEVTAGPNVGTFDLVLDNGSDQKTIAPSAIKVMNLSDSVVDLRSGGTEFTTAAIAVRSDMRFVRTGNGLYFLGRSPWGSWARFVGDNREWVWNRNLKRTVSWIFTNTNRLMLGIGSESNRQSSDTQYAEGEILAYFPSPTIIDRFFGNNGTLGNTVVQQIGFNWSDSTAKKLVLESNGEPGSRYSFYQLPSEDPADWLDTSNLIATGTIENQMSADEPTIMPFVIPDNGDSTLFLGFILE